MHIDKDIAALRSNRAPQRSAQKAVHTAWMGWREDEAGATMLRELEEFGGGAPLTQGGVLEGMFMQSGKAEHLIGDLSQRMCACFKANRFAQAPFRNGFDGRTGTTLLSRSGRAQLLLESRDPGDYAHKSRVFSDGVRYDAVLGGAGEARLFHLHKGDGASGHFTHEALALRPGSRLSLDLLNQSLEVDRVHRRMVTLRLVRSAQTPETTKEFCTDTGVLMQQSAGNLATSRLEAIIALLGRMKRTDAAPQLASIATGDGDVSLRWQALRECLGMDTAKGFAALCQLARSPADPLFSDAAALRAQLLETYPQLADLERTLCRA